MFLRPAIDLAYGVGLGASYRYFPLGRVAESDCSRNRYAGDFCVRSVTESLMEVDGCVREDCPIFMALLTLLIRRHFSVWN